MSHDKSTTTSYEEHGGFAVGAKVLFVNLADKSLNGPRETKRCLWEVWGQWL